jgi:pyruvate dehydrogenase E2 component (dihydrolipoamide acetyltransferase)
MVLSKSSWCWARTIQRRLQTERSWFLRSGQKDEARWRRNDWQLFQQRTSVSVQQYQWSRPVRLEPSYPLASRLASAVFAARRPEGTRRFSSAATALPPHIPIRMPALSPTMKVGNLLSWKRKEGDTVSAGDVLAEIETDKATIEFESQEEGVLAKILVPDGTQDVPVGALIAVLAEDAEEVAALQKHSWDSATQANDRQVETKPQALPPEGSSGPSPQEHEAATLESIPWRYGPAVAAMLANHSMPAGWRSKLRPSGPRGHILKEDLLSLFEAVAEEPRPMELHASERAQEPTTVASRPATVQMDKELLATSPQLESAHAAYRDISLSQVRRVIAERLLESKRNAPHAYQSLMVNFEALLEMRQSLNALAAGSLRALRTPKLTVNDFLLRAVAIALREHKSMNSNADRVDLAFAVATPAGLITPIVRDADTKSVVAIALESQDLVQRARQNKLKLHEFQGGSFSISNLGMVPSITRFTAIINPPQAGILAIGAPQIRLVPDSTSHLNDENAIPAHMKQTRLATLTLSYDASRVHRSASIAFLIDLQQLVENPSWLLV